jgi:hypothetical protein
LGNEVQSVRGASETTASLPFVNASWHQDGVGVSYRAATSPELQNAGEVADTNTLTPMISVQDGRVRIARGLHQELRFEDNTATRRASVAVYQDELHNPVISGSGRVSQADLASGNVLYDSLSDSFQMTGPGYTTGGVSAVLEQKFGGVWTTLAYANGKALAMEVPESSVNVEDAIQSLAQVRTEAVTAALRGNVSRTGTTWRAAYRWQPDATVTPVAVYDSFGDSAYLNILIRQRIRCGHLLPNGTEALVDVRNLLAQGYRPFLTSDGSTLYFAQTARSIVGGLSFTF